MTLTSPGTTVQLSPGLYSLESRGFRISKERVTLVDVDFVASA